MVQQTTQMPRLTDFLLFLGTLAAMTAASLYTVHILWTFANTLFH